jgi:hypothetical protein
MVLLLEWVAALDLISDFQIIVMLWQTKYAVWLAVTVVTNFAPVFVSYIPLILYLKTRIQ